MSVFNFSINGHVMSLIEVDGTETVPGEKFSAFSLYPGQRASLVLKANKPVGNYCKRLS
jgi:iron transport multicopper oxidase